MIEFSEAITKSEADYIAWSRKERRRLERDPEALLEAVKSARFFWLAPEDRAALVERAGEHPPGVYTVLAPKGERRPQPLGRTASTSIDPAHRRSKFEIARRSSWRGVAKCLVASTLAIILVDSLGRLG